MRFLFSRYALWYVLIAITAGLLAAGYFAYTTDGTRATNAERAAVTRGTVSQAVTVSGKVEAKYVARVGFPTAGKVNRVYKSQGDRVTEGEILASLAHDSLIADYNSAREYLRYLESEKAELLRGPQDEARRVTRTNVEIALDDLRRVTEEQERLVENARKLLLSSDLAALPAMKTNGNTPPQISGNYLCDEEGSYLLTIYGSQSETGFSYRLSGLEEGTFIAYANAPAPLGTCGLMIKFNADEWYRTDTWEISIPNTRSASYITLKNAYDLAIQQRQNAVAAAEQALELAENTQASVNAPPTKEALDKIGAQIAQASAHLATKEAQIADYTVRAPFDALVTGSNIKVGEVADATKTMSLVREGFYELKARIPEVDITKVKIGSQVLVRFDAEPKQPVPGIVEFISPLSSSIEGVAYYEARIALSNEPAWLREGLSADVDIIITEKHSVLTLPKRFIASDADGSYTYTSNLGQLIRTRVETGIVGNDGHVEVLNLPEGTTVTLP